MRGIVNRFVQADQARCAKERRLGQPSKFRPDGWEAVVPWLCELCFVCHHKIKAHVNIQPEPWFLSFQLRHCLLEQLTIQIETHCHDVAALRGSENAARAANLQIPHGDAKTSA